MRILNTTIVCDFLDQENGGCHNVINYATQIIITHKCGCKITVDKNESLFPCSKHNEWAQSKRDNITLHKVLH